MFAGTFRYVSIVASPSLCVARSASLLSGNATKATMDKKKEKTVYALHLDILGVIPKYPTQRYRYEEYVLSSSNNIINNMLIMLYCTSSNNLKL